MHSIIQSVVGISLRNYNHRNHRFYCTSCFSKSRTLCSRIRRHNFCRILIFNIQQLYRVSFSSSQTIQKHKGSIPCNGGKECLLLLAELKARNKQKSAHASVSSPNEKSSINPKTHHLHAESTHNIASRFCHSYLALPAMLQRRSLSNEYWYIMNEDGRKEEQQKDAICLRSRTIALFLNNCSTDVDAISKSVSLFSEDNGSNMGKINGDGFAVINRIRVSCTPNYERLLQLIVAEADREVGIKFVVQFRSDLLTKLDLMVDINSTESLEQTRKNNELLRAYQQFDSDLKNMLILWFSFGILDLQQISYERTPASIIEKIAKKEAVHPLRSLDDLRNRLSGQGRRCYAFFHPSIPGEPLVFVHVALLSEVADSMETIHLPASYLNEQHSRIDEIIPTSVGLFYSITSTQKGLNGVSLGNTLIKRVVEKLKNEFSSMKTFATLSPIPGFRKWLEKNISGKTDFSFTSRTDGKSFTMLSADEINKLKTYFQCDEADLPIKIVCAVSLSNSMTTEIHSKPWHEVTELREMLRPLLERLCAFYLLHEKDKYNSKPVDTVAKFHLRNGAEIFRLNWMASNSRKIMSESMGIMVNYIYRLENTERNHVLFDREGYICAHENLTNILNSL